MKTWSILCVLTAAYQMADAAPTLKPKDDYYHPTKVGDTRVYETRSGEKVLEVVTVIVTKVETTDDRFQVEVSTERELAAQKFITRHTVEVSPKGVVRIVVEGELPNPMTLLKLPTKVGDSWNGPNMRPTYTVVKVDEMVEVPAGKFRAIKIEFAMGTDPKTTVWHAPCVGVVKTMINLGGTERSQVLKAFTPGK